MACPASGRGGAPPTLSAAAPAPGILQEATACAQFAVQSACKRPVRAGALRISAIRVPASGAGCMHASSSCGGRLPSIHSIVHHSASLAPLASLLATMRVSVKVQGLALLVLLLASASLTEAAAPAYDKPPGKPSPASLAPHGRGMRLPRSCNRLCIHTRATDVGDGPANWGHTSLPTLPRSVYVLRGRYCSVCTLTAIAYSVVHSRHGIAGIA
jgi:hypothetical protein